MVVGRIQFLADCYIKNLSSSKLWVEAVVNSLLYKLSRGQLTSHICLHQSGKSKNKVEATEFYNLILEETSHHFAVLYLLEVSISSLHSWGGDNTRCKYQKSGIIETILKAP